MRGLNRVKEGLNRVNLVRPLATLFLKNKVNEVVEIAASFSCIFVVIRHRFVYTDNGINDRHSRSSGTLYTWCMSAHDEQRG